MPQPLRVGRTSESGRARSVPHTRGRRLLVSSRRRGQKLARNSSLTDYELALKDRGAGGPITSAATTVDVKFSGADLYPTVPPSPFQTHSCSRPVESSQWSLLPPWPAEALMPHDANRQARPLLPQTRRRRPRPPRQALRMRRRIQLASVRIADGLEAIPEQLCGSSRGVISSVRTARCGMTPLMGRSSVTT